MHDLLLAWQAWLVATGHASRTVETYVDIVRRCCADPARISTAEIVGFLAAARSAGTRRTRWTALRAWCRWLIRQGLRADDPTATLDPPRVPRGTPRPLSDAEVRRLLALRVRRRTRAMLLLGLYQGLRASEIARVRGEDVDPASGTLRVPHGKGGSDRLLPLHPAVADIARTMPRRGWWFPHRDAPGEPMTRVGVTSVLRAVMRRAGVAEGSAHRLRHTYATRLLAAGVDIRVVQELLRHASIATTQIYTRVNWTRMAEGLARLAYAA